MNENVMNLQYIEDLDTEHLNARFELKESLLCLNENNAEKSSSSKEKVQELEKSYEGLILKELPKNLKYVFLGAEISKLMIITIDLVEDTEQKLIEILRKYKEAIALIVEDLKGISPPIYMNKILLEESEKTSIERQRRLNQIMKEVFKKEVLKWLNARFIYAISYGR